MAPTNPTLLYPMYAMFILSAIVLLRMFFLRVQAIKSRQIKISYFRTYTQEGGPEKMIQASRHFSNLFEAPVLFYVACLLGLIFSEGHLFLSLAWLYVFFRAAHAYIHMGSNNVISRMRVYGLSWLVLALMWSLLVFHQLFPSASHF